MGLRNAEPLPSADGSASVSKKGGDFMKGGNHSCDYCDPMGSCCMHPIGLIHAVAGVGLGFLLVEYFGLFDNLATWGWILVGVGVAGHFLKRKY